MGKRILIVEDEWAIRTLIVEFLRESGFFVAEAESGAEALRLAEADDRYDLLITDLNLGPGLNGRQVATHVRQRYPDLPVVFASAYPAEPADREPPLAIKAFLKKPFSRSQMLEIVDAVVGV